MPKNPLTSVSYTLNSSHGSHVHSTTEIHVDLQDSLSSPGRGTVVVRKRLDCLHEILVGDPAAPAAFDQ